jgi:hypothetical protein
MGIWQGTPGLSVGLYIWKGIIPALLGNIIGGGLFVGVLYWYLHIQGTPDIAIDGVYYGTIPGQNPVAVARGPSSAPTEDLEAGKSIASNPTAPGAINGH